MDDSSTNYKQRETRIPPGNVVFVLPILKGYRFMQAHSYPMSTQRKLAVPSNIHSFSSAPKFPFPEFSSADAHAEPDNNKLISHFPIVTIVIFLPDPSKIFRKCSQWEKYNSTFLFNFSCSLLTMFSKIYIFQFFHYFF